jgi:hypothetical protein|tara:strand:+ start:3438 stop:3653 length:216 start_codon:yes stop_codon:yes gene_type:complete
MSEESKRKKSLKREVGGALLLAACLISYHYWTLEDAKLVAAYAPSYSALMFALIPTGFAGFGIHYIWKGDA